MVIKKLADNASFLVLTAIRPAIVFAGLIMIKIYFIKHP